MPPVQSVFMQIRKQCPTRRERSRERRTRAGTGRAEPVPLTQALMAQRLSIGQFNVFLGMTHSDTSRPEHADCIAFSSYCGTGGNRALVKAGLLDILPCHYSQLPGLIQSGRGKIDGAMRAAPPGR